MPDLENMIKSDMLKNAIESADYYSDSRKRKYLIRCRSAKASCLLKGTCGASTMDVFHHV